MRLASGLLAAISSSGVPLRLRMVRKVVAVVTFTAACGVKARIGTAARLTRRLTRGRVPAPPEAAQADSSPASTIAQTTGPAALRTRSASQLRPGTAGAGEAVPAATAVTARSVPA